MKTISRTCCKNQTIMDGDKTLQLISGKEYITSEIDKDGYVYVTVFSSYWTKVSADVYFGAPMTTSRGMRVPSLRRTGHYIKKSVNTRSMYCQISVNEKESK